MLLILYMGTLLSFYLFIDYEVMQSITISFMMNLSIRAQTMANIKTNEIELAGLDLA